MNEQVTRIMTALKCDEQTALSILADDARIDKGEKLFEQTAEQKAASKIYRQVERKPTVYKFTPRERKQDADKRGLIELLRSAVVMVADETPVVSNAERQIDFVFNNRKFKIVLSCPRG